MNSTRRSAAILAITLAWACAPRAATADDPPTEAEQRARDAARLEQATKSFDQHDRDGNGTVAGEEVPKGWLDAFDLDGDDRVARSEFLEIRTHAVLERAHPLRHDRARATQALRSFDRDMDGVVTMEEYPGDRNTFKRHDRNKDEKLDWPELLRMARAELSDFRKRMKSPGRRDFLELFDLTGDRNVARAEYDGPSRAFAKYDTDGDGTVTYYELYPDRMRMAMESMERNRAAAEDVDVIESMDADDDGRVSREEFKGTDAAWMRLDRNKDGWISQSDAR